MGVALVAVTALVAASFVWPGPWLVSHWRCSAGPIPSTAGWWQDECVGYTDGPYAFGQSGLQAVFTALEQQNSDQAIRQCDGTPVTVGVLTTLSSDNAVGRAQHELEGFVATQAAANASSDCRRPVKLRVGQVGASHQAAVEVANRLVDSGVVALVGMGLSDPQTAAAVNAVAAGPTPVPMVADLVSAEGFDQDASRVDNPDFSHCTDTRDYVNGIGKGDDGGWFYRAAFRNTVQITSLAKAWHSRMPVSFLIKPGSTGDPATCTQQEEYRRQFYGPQPLTFYPDDAQVTLDQVINPICAETGPIAVIYGARGRDLPILLNGIDERYKNGGCTPTSITVLAGSDSSRLRSTDPDQQRDKRRLAALRSPSFSSGKVVLIQTPLADPSVPPISTSSDYRSLVQAFDTVGFSAGDLDDGWALNAHDALTTVIEAAGGISAKQEVTPKRVHVAIADNFLTRPVNHTIQPLTFDASGNRVGGPAVVRLCPLPNDDTPDPRTRTVLIGHDDLGICR